MAFAKRRLFQITLPFNNSFRNRKAFAKRRLFQITLPFNNSFRNRKAFAKRRLNKKPPTQIGHFTLTHTTKIHTHRSISKKFARRRYARTFNSDKSDILRTNSTMSPIVISNLENDPKGPEKLLQLLESIFHNGNLSNTHTYLKDLCRQRRPAWKNVFEIITEKTWTIDLPLWCVCNTFNGPKDAIFAKDIADLHDELDKLSTQGDISITELSEYIDLLFLLQTKFILFPSVYDLIQFSVLIRGPRELIVNFFYGASTDNWAKKIQSLKDRWIQNYIDKANSLARQDFRYSLDQSMIKRITKSDLRYLHSILENGVENQENAISLFALVHDLEASNVSDQEWKELVALDLKSVQVLYIKLMVQTVKNLLKSSVNIHTGIGENGRGNGQAAIQRGHALLASITSLYAEHRTRLRIFLILARYTINEQDFEYYIDVLNLVYEYGVNIEEQAFEMLKSVSSSRWVDVIFEKIILMIFPTESAEQDYKTIMDLINEKSSSFGQKRPISYAILDKMFQEYQGEYQKIRSYSLEQIKLKMQQYWMQIRNRAPAWLENKYQKIAFAVHGVNLYFGNKACPVKLRDVQILTILMAVHARGNHQGRLFQVQTGEGKTYVIAAIAIINALNGTKVDIVTSSSELAVNQFEQLKDFYKLFGLVAEHNTNNNSLNKYCGQDGWDAVNNRLDCLLRGRPDPGSILETGQVYHANIVYGSVEDYLADVLHDEFAKSGVRCKRGFNLVIVDEVDSMFIDGRSDSVRLSGKTPGMNDLLQLYTTIWSQICHVHSQLKEIDGQWYYVADGNCSLLEDDSVDSFAIKSTLPFLRKATGFDKLTTEESGDSNWDEKISAKDAKQAPAFPRLQIPAYLRPFIEIQLSRWIKSAINARFHMHPGFDYVLSKDKKIVVVDASNTGVHHPTMRWSDGLHQFLQMKHGCFLEAEALATNFISNATFFLRYKTNILGLTGTIGNESSRKFLSEVYDVDFVDVPPFRARRHHEMVPYLCASEKEWLEEIVETTSFKLEHGRAVLIITNFIEHAHQLATKLRSRSKTNRVFLYTDREGTQVVSETLLPGDCVVATNIAGRGTDLGVSKEVQQKGGLHVLLTFMPENERVERQNIGRTSRTGNPGTSQVILNLLALPMGVLLALNDEPVDNVRLSRHSVLNNLRVRRNELSMDAVNTALVEIEKTKYRDEAFQKFMEIREDITTKVQPNQVEAATSSLDSTFGRWLRIEENVNKKSLEMHFQTQKGNPINNPYDFVMAAKKYMGDDNKTCLDLLNKSVALDPEMCAIVYYIRACCYVDMYRIDRTTSNMRLAIQNFEKARELLEKKNLHHHLMIQASSQMIQDVKDENSIEKKEIPKTELIEQMEKLTVITSSLISNIDNLIGRKIDDDLDYLNKQLASKDTPSEQKTTLQKQRQELIDNRSKIENGILRPLLSSNSEIKIKFLPIDEALPRSEIISRYKRELEQFSDDQFTHVIEVNEKAPINWWAVSALAGIAILQVVGGASAAIFSLGAAATVGWALLQEGVCDMIIAIKDGIVNRNFSWKSWGIQKAISLTITIVSAGFSAIKEAARGVVKGTKAVCSVLTQSAKRVTREGFRLACRAVGVTVAKEVTKLALCRVADYACAETIESVIRKEVIGAVRDALVNMFGNDNNLKKLLACDEINQNKKYSEMLAEKFMGYFYNNNALSKQLKNGTMSLLNRVLKNKGFGAEAKLLSMVSQTINVAEILKMITSNLQNLTAILQDMVCQENYRIDEIINGKQKQEGDSVKRSRMDDQQAYVSITRLYVQDFLESLSNNIGGLLSDQMMGSVKQFLISKAVDYGAHNLTDVYKDIEEHREKFIDSKIVVENIQLKRKTLFTEHEMETADYVEGVAKEAPGDLQQAKYLSEVVEQPIRIKTIDESGQERIIYVGTHFGGEPIELGYERASRDSIGHYTLADGTPVSPSGNNSCLFDAISTKTGYESDLLRRGAANMMLNRFDDVSADLKNQRFADMMTGGDQDHRSRDSISNKNFLKIRTRSPSARRHTFLTSAATTPAMIIRHVQNVVLPAREAAILNSGLSTDLPNKNTLLDMSGDTFDNTIQTYFNNYNGVLSICKTYECPFPNVPVNIAYMRDNGRAVDYIVRARADVKFNVSISMNGSRMVAKAYHLASSTNIRDKQEIWRYK